MLILGIEDVNYISKKTNKQVIGKRLHMSFTNEKIIGQGVESVFISSIICDANALTIGDNIELLYNKYGQVTDVRII